MRAAAGRSSIAADPDLRGQFGAAVAGSGVGKGPAGRVSGRGEQAERFREPGAHPAILTVGRGVMRSVLAPLGVPLMTR